MGCANECNGVAGLILLGILREPLVDTISGKRTEMGHCPEPKDKIWPVSVPKERNFSTAPRPSVGF